MPKKTKYFNWQIIHSCILNATYPSAKNLFFNQIPPKAVNFCEFQNWLFEISCMVSIWEKWVKNGWNEKIQFVRMKITWKNRHWSISKKKSNQTSVRLVILQILIQFHWIFSINIVCSHLEYFHCCCAFMNPKKKMK